MKQIRAGVIGVGFIGTTHIEALRRLGFAEVVAIATSSEETAEKKARQLCIPQAYGNWHQLLVKEKIDVLHNCTPNYLHFKINAEAIKRRIPIVSEKPLGVNFEETATLVEMAEQYKVPNAVCFNYRFYPLIQQIREIIMAGELGEIYLVHGRYLQDWLLYAEDYNWRIDTRLGGKTRAIADIGSHWCDTVQFLTGQKIKRLVSDLQIFIPHRWRPELGVESFKTARRHSRGREKITVKTEDYASVLFEMNGGAKGCFIVSQISAGRKNAFSLEINGSKGSVWWDQETPDQLWLGYREKPNAVLIKDPTLLKPSAQACAHYPGGHPEGYPDTFKNLFQKFYSILLKESSHSSKQPEYPTFRDGHLAAVISEAILYSYKNQHWVEISL